METEIRLNSPDIFNTASFEISEEATLSEAVFTIELALRANGYIFDSLEIKTLEDGIVENFVLGDTERCEDSCYPTTDINNEDEVWEAQIQVHHYSEEESKALANRICYLLNRYGAE